MKGRELTQEQIVAGTHITGVSPKSGLKPNVNAEDGEYVMTPDGSVLEVWGKKHKDGGTNMILPAMTAILSDTKNLTLTKEDVKKLEKDFNLKGMKTSHTYADVLDRYSRKIGLTKLNWELEDYQKQIKKQIDNTSDETTSNLNISFIASKIDEAQQQVVEKQGAMREMFTTMFTSQQKQKTDKNIPMEYQPTEEQIPLEEDVIPNGEVIGAPTVQDTEMLTEMEMFELGGYVGQIRNLSEKFKWSERKVYDHLKNKNLIPKFDNGGIVIDYGKNTYQEEERVKQSANTRAYGKVEAQTAIEQLYRQFPLVLRQEKYQDVITLKDGKPVLKEGVTLNKINTTIESLQRDMSKQMVTSAERIVNDTSGVFTKEQKDQAQKYIQEETFLDDESVRGYDGKLGNFTSGRTSLGLSLVTPEELKKLHDRGIYSYKQLKENPDVFNILSETSKTNVNKLGEDLPEDADYRISQYTLPPATAKPPTTPEEKVTEYDSPPIVDDIQLARPKSRIPRAYWSPDQSLPMPDALQPETLEQIELQRLDPVRVGIEPVLSRIGKERDFVASQLENMPSSLRASVLANTVATSQQAETEAIMNATAQNAQNFTVAEQYNAGKADAETTANAQQRLGYEQRVLKGLDNYNQNTHNWLMGNRAIYLNEYENQINLNRLNNMFPDVSIDAFGIGHYYDPSYQYRVQPTSNSIQKLYGVANQSWTPPAGVSKNKKVKE